MKTRQVPTVYTSLFQNMLSCRSTQICFDDHISNPISINNGTMQGCLLSMLLYTFYNADLIDIATGENELSTRFVNDCAFVAISDTLQETHATLKNMMERAGGGVTFDSKLSWKAHSAKTIASATRWVQQLWCISKTASGLSPAQTHQLYITVALPAFTYASDIWYTPPFKTMHSQKYSGSVGITKQLQKVQGTATRYITGALRGTTFDIMDAHVNIPPIDLLVCKAQFWAASRISTLPQHHPLHSIAHRAASRLVWLHRSPLHYLFFITGINPNTTETISPYRWHPTYKPTMSTIIDNDTKRALQTASTAHHITQFKVYCDGSRYQGGAGAAAILYDGNTAAKSLYLHIGPANEHTVYETELVGIILALHLLVLITCLITSTIIIGLGNQATIKSLNNQKPKPAHYLLDQIHTAAKLLNSKQDQIQRRSNLILARNNGHHPVIRTRGVCDLRIH